MPILFCNIGWMNKYNGLDGDSIERGGEYNKHSIGHEVCNFSENNGKFYGYVQPTGQIKIEKLGASRKDDFVRNITVVWTAGPASGGTVVIGWYKNATVYRKLMKIPNPTELQIKSGVLDYRIDTATQEAVLLPIEQRELIIPRAVKGGIGQSNVWYADQPESQELVARVTELIANGTNPKLPDVDFFQSCTEGNPRLTNHIRRERNAKLVKAKKEAALREKGNLRCEVCNFDFRQVYGELGNGFCEVHHLKPLSKCDGVVITELFDLAIMCSNCHRIIHKTNPMLTIKEFSKKLKK